MALGGDIGMSLSQLLSVFEHLIADNSINVYNVFDLQMAAAVT